MVEEIQGTYFCFAQDAGWEMTQQEELKPCPFCGGKSYKHENKSGAVSRYIIECYDCRASSAYDAHEVNLIKKWNTRATPDIANFIEACDRRAEQKMLKTGKIEGAHYAVMREFAAEMGVYLPPPKFSLIVKNHDQPDHTEVLKMAMDALENTADYGVDTFLGNAPKNPLDLSLIKQTLAAINAALEGK